MIPAGLHIELPGGAKNFNQDDQKDRDWHNREVEFASMMRIFSLCANTV
jgi:hypothetical protein